MPGRAPGQRRAGHGRDLAAEVGGDLGGDQRARALRGLDDDGRRRRGAAIVRLRAGKHQRCGAKPGGSSESTQCRAASSRCSARLLAGEARSAPPASTATVGAAGLERPGVGGAVDAEGHAADDGDAGRRQARGRARARPRGRPRRRGGCRRPPPRGRRRRRSADERGQTAGIAGDVQDGGRVVRGRAGAPGRRRRAGRRARARRARGRPQAPGLDRRELAARPAAAARRRAPRRARRRSSASTARSRPPASRRAPARGGRPGGRPATCAAGTRRRPSRAPPGGAAGVRPVASRRLAPVGVLAEAERRERRASRVDLRRCPSRSAIVRATRRTRSWPRALSGRAS